MSVALVIHCDPIAMHYVASKSMVASEQLQLLEVRGPFSMVGALNLSVSDSQLGLSGAID